ncbi:hypothetical protein MetMK1DRAFT_00000830 [Metallosphaera yellowstonensis MK1]|jgi:hypothetical protein|uniref:Uncharacterized protein n=1 Tax=Metallosphaera yellowstonensis MK1 TaxID=671065 RepID=H2C0L2_9CREN|nr:hypothetical protein [Metallosphaera yellowstonensis]EHP71274.1 hypothetical protein MetMK1DRAFT_00000830 [Metallosphaera yellowstonensis MK1]
MRNEERSIREADMRLVREINRLDVVRRNGRSRKFLLSIVLMILRAGGPA